MLNQAFQSFIPGGIYAFMLVFARIGALVMLIPGIGESYVSTRIRLALALLVAGLIGPKRRRCADLTGPSARRQRQQRDRRAQPLAAHRALPTLCR